MTPAAPANQDHVRERRAIVLALALGIVLTVVKFIAWRMTGSSAVYSDAVESIVNIAASGFALWAIHQAHRPADRTHPYGHGRFEFLSASAEGALIAAAAVSIVWEAVHRMLAGDIHVERAGWGIAVVGATVAANAAMGTWLLVLGRRRKSSALESDGKHLLTDSVTSLGAIAALLLVHFTGQAWIDPVIALVMACVILVVGYRIVRHALGNLLDEQDAGDYETVRKILDEHVAAPGRTPRAPAILGWHKLRTRHVGRHHWVDFHVQVPGTMDVRSAHELATAIELEIEAALGCGEDGGNATAHVEPAE
jgi:cation diffusion facilitator family transporter